MKENIDCTYQKSREIFIMKGNVTMHRPFWNICLITSLIFVQNNFMVLTETKHLAELLAQINRISMRISPILLKEDNLSKEANSISL